MAGLTKQHFENIAKILSNVHNDIAEEIQFNEIIRRLSEYFKTQNPLFAENRFKKACLE